MQLILSHSDALRTDIVPLRARPRWRGYHGSTAFSQRSGRAVADQYGLPWQVVPNKWGKKGNHAVGMQRLMQMKKIDIAALERTYNGEY